jgi:hypothetical protein
MINIHRRRSSGRGQGKRGAGFIGGAAGGEMRPVSGECVLELRTNG